MCLADIMMSTFFIHISLCFRTVFQVCPYLCFFWAVSRRYAAASSTSQTVYIVYTWTGCFWSNSKVFFCQKVFREIWHLSTFLTRVSGSAVSSELKFLGARNLTCLQPLPNALYTNYNSLKHHSFWSVWAQKQNKSRCILGVFIGPLTLYFAMS